ncbi:hypothetical protein Pcinc_009098 [Petrolisthes cinctipes]|uniref:Uncharacterized protein n=1 Tax=Petrolisthes cinctipes TaxID=88211 RepID=A0AAE1KWN7_PETCI|nr:hypothetical protein Pcinc_009098 [Petrolisthes cinctipes]
MVSPEIQKQNTHLREAIPPEQRLSVTLRYLAKGSGESGLNSIDDSGVGEALVDPGKDVPLVELDPG